MKPADDLRARLPTLNPAEADWLKGLLILFVVADHNDYFRAADANIFRPLTFHVLGFFLINFYGSFFGHKAFGRFFCERVVRYLWPFLCFYAFYALAHRLSDGALVGPSAQDFVTGAVVGSFATVKLGCGAAFMWFMPALFGYALLCKLVAGLGRWGLMVFLLASGVLHWQLMQVSAVLSEYVPWGLGVAVYLAPLVAAFVGMQAFAPLRRASESLPGMLVNLLIFVLAYGQLVDSRVTVEIGSLTAPASDQILLQIWNFLQNLSASLFLWALARRCATGLAPLRSIGRHSLSIYLLHPLCLHIFAVLVSATGVMWWAQYPWLEGTFAFIFALGTAWAIAGLFERSVHLQTFLFPRDFAKLREAVTFTKQPDAR